MTEAPENTGTASPVARYKAILRRILETRPSGTRQRLAEALGKNRSFISQISSPSYSTPLPSRYLDRLFEVCHFSAQEREEFLSSYRQAHPHRRAGGPRTPPLRRVTLRVPDLGDPARNQAFDHALEDFAGRIARLATSES